jgi:hypothetical protein
VSIDAGLLALTMDYVADFASFAPPGKWQRNLLPAIQ